jgi:hypothetical protein
MPTEETGIFGRTSYYLQLQEDHDRLKAMFEAKEAEMAALIKQHEKQMKQQYNKLAYRVRLAEGATAAATVAASEPGEVRPTPAKRRAFADSCDATTRGGQWKWKKARADQFSEYVSDDAFTLPVPDPARKPADQRALDTVLCYVQLEHQRNPVACNHLMSGLLAMVPELTALVASDAVGRAALADATAPILAERLQASWTASLGLELKDSANLSWNQIGLVHKLIWMRYNEAEGRWEKREFAPGVPMPILPGRYAITSLRKSVLESAGMVESADGNTVTINVERRITQELTVARRETLLAAAAAAVAETGGVVWVRLLVSGDGQNLHRGFSVTALIYKLALPGEEFSQKVSELDTFLIMRGKDKHESMKARAGAGLDQLHPLFTDGLTLTVDGREIRVRFTPLMAGDIPFINAILGLSGHSHTYFCVICETATKNMLRVGGGGAAAGVLYFADSLAHPGPGRRLPGHLRLLLQGVC